MTKRFKKLTLVMALFMVFSLVMNTAAFAASSDDAADDFVTISNLLETWTEGSLGKVIALGVFLVGGVASIVQRSLMYGAVGAGSAVAMAYGPDILTSIFSATI